MNENKKNTKPEEKNIENSTEAQTKNNTNPINRQNKDALGDEVILYEDRKKEDLMDVSIFDETLKEIDSTLGILEQKTKEHIVDSIETDVLHTIKPSFLKNKLINEENNYPEKIDLILRIKNLETKVNEIEVSFLKSESSQVKISNITDEHKINEGSLSLLEIHNIEDNDQEKKKSSLGFFFYLVLINLIFVVLYGSLIYFKSTIILNFPSSEKHIIHFFEIVNIVKATFFEFINYFLNN